MNILVTALGYYETIGDPAQADIIAGCSYGTLTDDGSANRALADFIIEVEASRPIVADRKLIDSFPGNAGQLVTHPVDGQIVDYFGRGVATWGVLKKTKEVMETEGYETALLVAQACHVGRALRQAKKIGIHAIAPPDLPRVFDLGSDQRWTRSMPMWLPREVVGSLALRVQGKL